MIQNVIETIKTKIIDYRSNDSRFEFCVSIKHSCKGILFLAAPACLMFEMAPQENNARFAAHATTVCLPLCIDFATYEKIKKKKTIQSRVIFNG